MTATSGDGPDETVVHPEVEKLRRELSASEERSKELLTRLKYLQAEVENTRKQAEKERLEYLRTAAGHVVGRILPILDEFDLALKAAPVDNVAKGFRMVRDNLVKTLKEEGLEEIETDGTFDPYLHEAVAVLEDGGKRDGTIVEVLMTGYRFSSRVLRPAQVVVTRHSSERAEGSPPVDDEIQGGKNDG